MFVAPVVWIILDATLGVGGDSIALHDPLDSRLTVYDVLVGYIGDVRDADISVIDDDTLVIHLLGLAVLIYAILLAKAHLFDLVEIIVLVGLFICTVGNEDFWMWLNVFVVQVQFGQCTTGFAECQEIIYLLDNGDAWQ